MSCGCLKNAVTASGRVAVAVTKAVIGVITTGKLIASLDVRKGRMASCTECPHFLMPDGALGARCAVCGCFLQAKAALITEDCPEGKWPERKPI
jgi:hypothetical protein